MTIAPDGGWLARLSDPAGPNTTWFPEPLPANDVGRLIALVDRAGQHNVRPALARNLKQQLERDPEAMLAGDAETIGRSAAHMLEQAEDLRLADMVRAALLADIADRIMAEVNAQGIPAVLVKGPDFAISAYGGLHARTFGDIDLLVRPDAQQPMGEVLGRAGFTPVPPSAKRTSHTERGWVRPDPHGGNTLVEVHTDIVHAPELRAGQTLSYDLYADPEYGGVTPAARLVLAALHGATSHLFGRLQYVVDGLMIARMGVDPDELAARAKRSKATLATATMLRLAAEIYGCPASRTLLDTLGPVPWQRVERRLITAGMVIAAKDTHRWRFLPQRHVYRRLLAAQASAA